MFYSINIQHIKIYTAGIRIIVCNIFKTSFALLYLFGRNRHTRANIIRNNIKNISRIEALRLKNLIVSKYEASNKIKHTVSILNNAFNVIRQYLFIERIIAKNEQ